ncbi:MAG TPA: hypothetical protein VEC16_04745 [Alphaproteobacteria bacterium]|nr:hypothetical protein [Alphaproteobacteria bacterium]
MDLEQYLEKDILVFLDSKIEVKGVAKKDREEEYGLYNTKDYLKELNIALENDELSKAKKLFDELKNAYSKMPKNSSERKKVYAILEKMYEKIQEYVEIKEGKIEVIKEGSSEIFKERNANRNSKTEIKVEKVINNNTYQTINRSAIPLKFYVGDSTTSGQDAGGLAGSFEGFGPGSSADKKTSKMGSSIADSDAGVTGSSFGPKGADASGKGAGKGSTESEEDDFDLDKGISGKGRGSKIPDKITKNKYDDDPDRYIQANISDITDRLLYDFRRKFEEDEYEEDRKISALRAEIVSKVAEEIQTMFNAEKNQITGMMEKMRQELLDQAYKEAMEIISSKDSSNFSEKESNVVAAKSEVKKIEPLHIEKQSDEVVEHHQDDSKYSQEDHEMQLEEKKHEEDVARNIGSPEKHSSGFNFTGIDKDDFILVTHDEDGEFNESSQNPQDSKPHTSDNSSNYSAEDLKIVYEQAIYKMSEDNYKEAAQLLRKIIQSQPNNKAALIRLQECIERNPELDIENSNLSDEEISLMIQQQNQNSDIDLDLNAYNTYDSHVNVDKEEQLMMNIESTIHKGMNLGSKSKRSFSNDELQRMYEEGIYVMFQSNYEQAAQIFKDILRIRPDNKAAKIRLQECMESIHNA